MVARTNAVAPRALRNMAHASWVGAFTLIELMIVVTVIAIVAAVAIPAIGSSRRAANEASAVSSMRTLSTINHAYKTRFQSYASSLAALSATGYIDSLLGAGTKGGYSFTYSGASDSWTVVAVPTAAGQTGDRGFYLDDSGIIRYSNSGSATSSSTPLD